MSVFAGNARHRCSSNRLYLGVDDDATLAFLIGDERIDVEIYYFRMVG